MPNSKGGKKYKKGGKKNHSVERQLIYKDPKESQEYAKVTKVNGNRRFSLTCFDGIDRLGICAGNIKKRVWINNGDIVLICKWEFQTDDSKCHIIHKYEEDEVKRLQSEGQFPGSIQIGEENGYDDLDNNFTFSTDISDEEDIPVKEDLVEEEKAEVKEEDFFVDVDEYVNEYTIKETSKKQTTNKQTYRHHEGMKVIDIDDI